LKTELVQLLLKAGVVTDAQVDRAEKYNFGSSLAERLLCLGYGSEDDIFKIIKNKLKLPVIEGQELDNVPQTALNAIPAALIEQHHFLPFYTDEKTVKIALFDPTMDSYFRDITSSVTKQVYFFGARASTLSQALDEYFELDIPETFKFGKEQIADPKLAPPPLAEAVPGSTAKPAMPPLPPLPNAVPRAPEPKETPKEEAAPKPVTPAPAPTPTVEKKEEPAPVEIKKETQQAPAPQPEIKTMPEVKPEAKKDSLDFGCLIDASSFGDDDASFDDFKDVKNIVNPCGPNEPAKEETAPKEAPKVTQAAAPTVSKPAPEEEYISPIDIALDKDSIISAVNLELGKASKRSLILFVKYEDLVTVDGSGLKVSLQAPSFFKDVHDSNKRFYGMPPKSNASDEFFKGFGGSVPFDICVVPVSIEDEVFAILYAEGVENPMQVEEVAEKMAQAFDRILS